MSDQEKLKLEPVDVNTAYLVVLNAIIEEIVATGAANADSLADKIKDFAKRASIGSKNDNVIKLAGYFENVARNTKRRGD